MKNTKTYQDLRNETRNDLHNTFSVKNHKPVYQPFYKSMYQRQLKNNKILLGTIATMTVFGFALVVGCDVRTKGLIADNLALQAQVTTGLNMSVQYADYTKQLEDRLVDVSSRLPKSVKGKVSYYSKSGCLGCNENQIMANGKQFDETKFTIAYNKLPLNTIVKVTNLNNGKSVNAIVSDRGGFEKYGRIADLSLATCKAIDCETDKSIIEINL